MEIELRSDQPWKCRYNQVITEVNAMGMRNRHVTIQEIAEDVAISTFSAHSIITEDMAITTTLQHIPRTLFRLFLGKEPSPSDSAAFLHPS